MPRFEELYSKLNTAQKLAVDTIDGPVMVIAGPGTGKTSILTLRIATIVKQTDTRPEQILALTFTESGVQSMRAKLIDIMGVEAYKVNIFTFHGFANVQIKRFPDVFPRIIASDNASDSDKTAIIESIIDRGTWNILRPYGDPHYYVSSIISSIQHLKRENMSVEDFEKYIEKREAEFSSNDDVYYMSGTHKGKMKGKYAGEQKHIEKNKELIIAYREYEKALAEKKLYDFEDMLLELIKAMRENQDFLLSLQEEYQYLLADEHQDANNSQNTILELLASFHESPNLFVVGDEKQAIFRFQGASLQNFLYFKDKYPGVTLIKLESNYRSTQSILDASHSLIGHTEGKKEGRVRLMAHASHEPHPISIAELSTEDVERKWLAGEIKKLIAAGVEPGEIAVLFRKNKEADGISQVFNSEGIPYALFTDQDMLEDHEVRKLILILEAINDPLQEGYIAEIMFFDLFDLPLLSIHAALRKSRQDHTPLLEMAAEIPELRTFHGLLVSFAKLAKNKELIGFFSEFLTKTRYSFYLIKDNHPLRSLASFEAFLNEVKRFAHTNRGAQLSDFLDYLHRLEKYHIRIKSNSFSKDPGKVALMTAHKSKGLEFEHVFIMNLTDSTWGNTRDMKKFDLPFASSSHIDDDRRLFYVGLTRAKKKAVLTYAVTSSEGKQVLPSQFVHEIEQEFVTKADVAKEEKEISKRSKTEDFISRRESFFDKEYLRKVFTTEHFSVTALNNYLACPMKYFFRNLIRIPELQTKHQMYGTAVHNALKAAMKKESTKAEFLLAFERELRAQPLAKTDYEESLNKGREALSGYFDTYHAAWPDNILTEYSITGRTVAIPHTDISITLRGIIDKIELTREDRHDMQDVHVVDYKTAKPKTRNEIEGTTKNATGDYKRQLIFYKLLLDDAHSMDNEKHYTVKTGAIDFIEPDEKGRYHKEVFEITENEVSELEVCIKTTLQEIYDFNFFDKGCGNKDCDGCGIYKLLS